MKKKLCVLLACVLLCGNLSGCGGRADTGVNAADGAAGGDTLNIVATIFPVYDWVREILGEQAGAVNLTLLLDSGVDLHNYQPTVDDMVRISNCDLFLYVGGESDRWVKDALAEAVNEKLVSVSLLDALGTRAKEEELVEGMEAGDEENEEDEAGPEYDEHIWLSLKNAAFLCGQIAETIGEISPSLRDACAANAAAYIEKLNALDAQYTEAVEAATVRAVLFGDRFPFRYLVDDCGLDYYAAFSGCSAETEASFETVVFLAGKVDELGLPAVLTIESGDGKIARTIVENTAAKTAWILCVDSLQSTTARDAAAGKTYLGTMEQNLEVFREALS